MIVNAKASKKRRMLVDSETRTACLVACLANRRLKQRNTRMIIAAEAESSERLWGNVVLMLNVVAVEMNATTAARRPRSESTSVLRERNSFMAACCSLRKFLADLLWAISRRIA